jgi:hypothetical protein
MTPASVNHATQRYATTRNCHSEATHEGNHVRVIDDPAGVIKICLTAFADRQPFSPINLETTLIAAIRAITQKL